MSIVSVSVQEDVGRMIDEKVAQYGYADASSYMRDLIRRDEAHAEWLRQELQAGLDSSISTRSPREAIDAGFERARRRCV